MPDRFAFHSLEPVVIFIMVPLVISAFAMTIAPIHFQNVYADECGEDKDWPQTDKPCPLYGAASETELKERWDKYYELKGKDWMEAKRTEMNQAIQNGTFTQWIRYAPDNNNTNRNVYFYYRLNNQAPLMVIDPQSNQYFMPQVQDPQMFTYSPISGDYYAKPASPPWHATPLGIYSILGVVSAGALASFFAVWKIKNK